MVTIALILVALVQYTEADQTHSNSTCGVTVVPALAAYTPSPFTPSWGVKVAAEVTSTEMPTDFSDPLSLVDGPYVQELINAVGVMVAFLTLILMAFCCYCCCRKTCCPCCKCCGPFKKRIPLKCLMLFWFSLIIITSLTGFSGRGDFIETADAFTKASDAVVDNIDEFIVLLNVVDGHAVAMNTSAQLLDGGDDGACAFGFDPSKPEEQTAAQIANDEVNKAAEILIDSIGDAQSSVTEALEQVTSVRDSVTDMLDDGEELITDFMVAYIEPATLGLVLTFVVIAAIGCCGTMAPSEGPRKCLYGSMICLAWPIINGIILLMALELLISVVVADTCTPTPFTTVTNIIPDGANSTIGFYISCEGTNPLQDVVDENKESYNDLHRDLCNVTKSIGESTRTYTDSGGTEQTITQVDAVGCTAALDDITLNIGGLMGKGTEFIDKAISCKILNQPLGILLEDGLCNSFAGGMYSMYASQVATVVFMLFGMYIVLPAWTQLNDQGKAATVTPACNENFVQIKTAST